jgi:hypothetical protein
MVKAARDCGVWAQRIRYSGLFLYKEHIRFSLAALSYILLCSLFCITCLEVIPPFYNSYTT